MRRAGARLESVTVTAVGEVDARGTFTLDGALTAGAWLRQTTRVTAGEAAGLVRTARVLRCGLLPATAAALAEGGLTGRHAQLIATAVADAPAGAVALIEPDAVALATTADVAATANLMRAFQHALDPDAPMPPRSARYDRAGVTFCPTLDGTVSISGSADPVSGSLLATAVDTAAPLRRRRPADRGPAPAGRAGRHLPRLPRPPRHRPHRPAAGTRT